MNHVRQKYIDIMAEIADSNILNILLSEITGEDMKVQKACSNLGSLIRLGEYALS